MLFWEKKREKNVVEPDVISTITLSMHINKKHSTLTDVNKWGLLSNISILSFHNNVGGFLLEKQIFSARFEGKSLWAYRHNGFSFMARVFGAHAHLSRHAHANPEAFPNQPCKDTDDAISMIFEEFFGFQVACIILVNITFLDHMSVYRLSLYRYFIIFLTSIFYHFRNFHYFLPVLSCHVTPHLDPCTSS